MREVDKPIWFEDEEKNRLIRVALLDALQLKMIKDIHSDADSDIENF